jgi:RNA polymerase sigma-70 factor (ECF subfamily)
MIDDKSLVILVASGDMRAFNTLIKQNQRLVGHMIGRLVDRDEDREELCQDVFLKVFEKINEFNFQSRLSTWIGTIAYRHAINYLRKKKIELHDISEEDEAANHFVDKNNLEENFEDEEMNNLVLKFIEKLPPQYKTVLTLYHLDSMSYPEIGAITGMPEGTVKSYLFRARQLLKDNVKQYLGKEEIL